MLVTVEKLLSADEIARIRAMLDAAAWVDGRATAGVQSALAKNNLQVPENSQQARDMGDIILRALGVNPLFNAAALPLHVFPPLFNRYAEGMTFGPHIDNAIRGLKRMRTDLSATLFLCEPEDYDGGELVVEDTYGAHEVKLSAGDMIVYPASSLHHVRPITRGVRTASFFWIQSMIRDDGQRALLFNMDVAIQQLAARVGQADPQIIALTGTYHNLLRRWAAV